MKALKVLTIALLATFSFTAANAQMRHHRMMRHHHHQVMHHRMHHHM